MHTLVRRALQAALVTGGLVVAGASMAHAAQEPAPDPALAVIDLRVGDGGGLLGLKSGDQVVHAPAQVPVDISGVAVAVGGDSTTGSGAPPAAAAGDGTGEPAVAAPVSAPINAPVTVSGVALGVLGDASASRGGRQPSTSSAGGPSVVSAPVNTPVTVSGVAFGVLGGAAVPSATSEPGTVPGGGTRTSSDGLATGSAGSTDASLALAASTVPTTAAVVLADTGWTPWLAVAAAILLTTGLVLRRASHGRPPQHLLSDRVPTQRGAPPQR